jgi:hypothetical protein
MEEVKIFLDLLEKVWHDGNMTRIAIVWVSPPGIHTDQPIGVVELGWRVMSALMH